MKYNKIGKTRFAVVGLLTEETRVYGVPVREWNKLFTGNLTEELAELREELPKLRQHCPVEGQEENGSDKLV
jgi:hypothetical protein